MELMFIVNAVKEMQYKEVVKCFSCLEAEVSGQRQLGIVWAGLALLFIGAKGQVIINHLSGSWNNGTIKAKLLIIQLV